jgi:hypothetical protein
VRRCCERFESCTTCPECGGRITPRRPTPPRGEDLDEAVAARLAAERADPRQDTGWQEEWQEDYYSGDDLSVPESTGRWRRRV